VRLGGALPDAFWTEAKITALCTQADYKIDMYTYPDTISTTSNLAIEIGVDVVLQMMRQADMYRKSGGATSGEGFTFSDVDILTPDIKKSIDNLLSDNFFGVTTVNLMEE
jgi:hypothetical protein